MIDPTKIDLYLQMEELDMAKLQFAIFDEPYDTQKLINTCQWLFERIERMEEDSIWWFSNATKEQMDQYYRDVHNYTDEDLKKMEESQARALVKIKEMIKNIKPDEN